MNPMYRRAEKILRKCGGLYSVEDVLAAIATGDMQSFSDGHTWVVTRVCEFPRKRVLDVVLVVGDFDGVGALEPIVLDFARKVGAESLMGTGRFGWLKKRPAKGWKASSVNFFKEV